jgi:hypothetical protein
MTRLKPCPDVPCDADCKSAGTVLQGLKPFFLPSNIAPKGATHKHSKGADPDAAAKGAANGRRYEFNVKDLKAAA